MKKMPANKEIKVSVILPVYNKAPFLVQCIDGILAQTLDDIEIICINDGSTDESLSILKKYEEKDSRVKVISQKNKGAAAARNVGLSQASGEFLSILDADDIFDPDMLLKAYERAKETLADIVVFRSNSYDDITKEYSDAVWTIKDRFLPGDLFSGTDVADHVLQFSVGWTWDKLFRKGFIDSLGLKFQDIRIHNDAFFTFAALLSAERIAIIHEILVSKRRAVNTSISSSSGANRYWKDLFIFIHAFDEYLISNNLKTQFEKSFNNLTLHLSMRMVSRVEGRSKIKLQKYLSKRIFPKYKLNERDKSYYYNRNEYEAMLSIINEYPSISMRLAKLAGHIKTHGIIATARQIVRRLVSAIGR